MWQGARLPDATEVAQDTMTKAYQRWSEIDHPKAWTRRVAFRAWVRRNADNKEELVADLSESNPLLPPLINVEVWEQRHDVLRMLDRLPPRQREVMAWTFEGYTPTEIAVELDSTAEAVRANLMKARRALAKYLSGTEDES